MPKVHDTRRQKAKELLERLERGPSFSEPYNKPWNVARDGFPAQYKRWCESWVIPLVKELVPELKTTKQPNTALSEVVGLRRTNKKKTALPRSTSARCNIMFGDDEVSLQDLRDRRDLAVRDGDMKLAMACAVAIDKKRGRY